MESLIRLLQRPPLKLSRRESEVESAAAGSTILDTAAELNIKSTSVITYRQRAYEKLKISRQGELVALIHQLRPSRPEWLTTLSGGAPHFLRHLGYQTELGELLIFREQVAQRC